MRRGFGVSMGNHWRTFIEHWFVPVLVSAAEIVGEIPADVKVYCPPSEPAPANSNGAAKKPFVTLHVLPGILNSGTEIGVTRLLMMKWPVLWQFVGITA